MSGGQFHKRGIGTHELTADNEEEKKSHVGLPFHMRNRKLIRLNSLYLSFFFYAVFLITFI